MKKSLFIIAMSLVATIGFTQENKWNAGLVIGYGTDISKASLGGRVVWDIIEPFSVAAGFNRYFKDSYDDGFVNTDVKYWDLNLDFHWNVLRGESYNVYPLIGLTYLHGKATAEGGGEKISNSDGKFGVNIGVGGQYNFSENWGAAIEAKYQIRDGGQFVPSLSVMYRF